MLTQSHTHFVLLYWSITDKMTPQSQQGSTVGLDFRHAFQHYWILTKEPPLSRWTIAKLTMSALLLCCPFCCQLRQQCCNAKNNGIKGILSWVYTEMWVWCLWYKQAGANNTANRQLHKPVPHPTPTPPQRERSRSSVSGGRQQEKWMTNKSCEHTHQTFFIARSFFFFQHQLYKTVRQWLTAFGLTV